MTYPGEKRVFSSCLAFFSYMCGAELRARTKRTAAWAAPTSTGKDEKKRHKVKVALSCRSLLQDCQKLKYHRITSSHEWTCSYFSDEIKKLVLFCTVTLRSNSFLLVHLGVFWKIMQHLSVHFMERTECLLKSLHCISPTTVSSLVLRLQEALSELVEPPFEPTMDFSLCVVSFKVYFLPYGSHLLPNE